VSAVALSADGEFVVSAALGIVKLWEVRTGRLIQTLEEHEHKIGEGALATDSKTVVWGTYNGGDVKMWDAATGKFIRTVKQEGMVLAVAFSPDRTTILSAGTIRSVKLWDAGTGALIRTLSHGGWV
jgi:WD40 repeat protein